MIFEALLRGINVGGNNKIEMKKLATVFESIGFTKITTYINSGNVIFESQTDLNHSKKIEAAIETNFGFFVRVVVRRADQIKLLNSLVNPEWINDAIEQKTDVIFLWDEVNNQKDVDGIIVNKLVGNLLYIKECGALVWNLKRQDYNHSGMDKFIGTKVYKNMTARNINTTRKIDSLIFNKTQK